MYNFRLYRNLHQNITRIRSLDLNAHCSVWSTVYITILHSLLFIHLKQSFPSLSTGDFTLSPRKQANRRRFQAFPSFLLLHQFFSQLHWIHWISALFLPWNEAVILPLSFCLAPQLLIFSSYAVFIILLLLPWTQLNQPHVLTAHSVYISGI